MLQQPVSELRSFQALSKYSGPRGAFARRQSLAQQRRQSQSRRRTDSESIDGSPSRLEAQPQQPSTSFRSADYPTSPHVKQVEWGDEDVVLDNDQYEIGADEISELPYPGFVEPALHCLKQASAPRSWALTAVMSPWFDRITMAVIVLNCITLGMYRPCEDGDDCTTYRCVALDIVDQIIFVYFTLEMVIKIVALGFYGQSAYLSDTWNRLDFFIVVAGIAEVFLKETVGNINLTAIRTIRVLRPLRAVNRIPSMRILVNLLLDTLPMLGNVLLLCFFVFFIFGIVGVQLWAGLLRNRCVLDLPNVNISSDELTFANISLSRYYIPEDTSMEYICSNHEHSGLHTCQNLPPYTQNGIRCNLSLDQYDQISDFACINWNLYYSKCEVEHRNPFQGSVSFDNIGFAWVAIFLVISLEGWTDIMYYVQDAHSFWNWIYFVLLIVIGAFFMINLCLVVIATQFAETKRRETERMLQERKRMQSQAGSLSGSEMGIATSSVEGGGGGDSVYAAIVRFIRQTFRRAKKYTKKRWKDYREKKKEDDEEIPVDEVKRRRMEFEEKRTLSKIDERVEEEMEQLDCVTPILVRKASEDMIPVLVQDRLTRENGKVAIGNGDGTVMRSRKNTEEIDTQRETLTETESDSEDWTDDEQNLKRGKQKKQKKPKKVSWFRRKVQAFVVCDHFTRGILVAILVNTLSMGVEYHNQPEWLTTVLEYSNYFFTGLFAFEMLLKIIADGLFKYLSDGFNLFDGGIVALSVVELFQEGKGGLSVLRTFRLLRILKLVRFMPALRYQLMVMLKTMDNVTVFFGLLILFIFIFSILGMNLFGCKFCKIETRKDRPMPWKKCERKNFDSLLWALITVFQQIAAGDCDCDRMNFDTFLWAVVTVFQILTQEDWNMVLFNGMSQTTPWAALYFVALMTFGNYVLFNLLVAILVEGFQESKEEEKRQLEEEARKNAIQEEDERKRELEILLARTTSSQFLAAHPRGSIDCTCPSTDPQHSPSHDMFGGFHSNRLGVGEMNGGTEMVPIVARTRVIGHGPPESDSDEEEMNLEKRQNRMNRHGSLALPRLVSGAQVSPRGRQRLHSWGGLHHALFNPNCPVHGRRALVEEYAREKFIQASQELKQALAEEEKREEEKQNSTIRKLLKKTCLNTRADHSLFCLGPKNTIRIRCLKLTQKKWFDYTILFMIGINCITLAMERPSIPPQSIERRFLNVSGYIFTIIFSVEMLLKVVANGCFFGRGAYFKDGWNILDGILVVISLVNILFEFIASGDSPKIFGVIRVLRLLRALRPLRVINRAPGVKLVVMTLISSLKPIGNIVLICCTFFIIFGILGVQLFKGMMHHCVGPEIGNVTTKIECKSDARNKWVNHRYNFDNLGQALMSLFVLSSKDGWVSIMYQGIDAVGVDVQPIENYNEWRMIYFISFLLLVGFFVLNMFVGVVVENFHKCKEALEREIKEKEREKRIQRKLKRAQFEECMANRKKKPEKTHPYWYNYGGTRLFLHGIVTSKYFDLAIAAVIGINVISMAMEFYMMPHGLKYVLKALNYFFTAVFTLESAMKLMALGVKRFMAERWNQLDMLIVILSIAGIIFEEFEALELPINPTIIRVMRVLRIARVLKLLKMAKGIRSLLDTVGEALPQVGNLGSLFFLLFFIFAALGVELFGKLECSEEHPCDGLGEHAHFKNFGMAFLTLFRIATGDNWNGIMKDALRDDCDISERCEVNCCVDPILAPCYFVIFVLISQFVLVNVVVAVLMKHLEESNKRDAAPDVPDEAADPDGHQTDTDREDEIKENPNAIPVATLDESKSPEAQRLASLKRLERQLIEAEKRLIQCGKHDLAKVAKIESIPIPDGPVFIDPENFPETADDGETGNAEENSDSSKQILLHQAPKKPKRQLSQKKAMRSTEFLETEHLNAF
ncbi:unnamed protein product, partial [Mesorhabditis belari]|uniref:Ion transport domain-containing protein n=1 Tax=Mesorhabditis belari TaxID=2138241 RepID=A0AAF3ES08_9BILA